MQQRVSTVIVVVFPAMLHQLFRLNHHILAFNKTEYK